MLKKFLIIVCGPISLNEELLGLSVYLPKFSTSLSFPEVLRVPFDVTASASSLSLSSPTKYVAASAMVARRWLSSTGTPCSVGCPKTLGGGGSKRSFALDAPYTVELLILFSSREVVVTGCLWV